MERNTKGSRVLGANGLRKRADEDYYATDPESVKLFLKSYPLIIKGRPVHTVLEPCCGGGHIAKTLKDYDDSLEIKTIDIVDRGYKDTDIVADFLTWNPDKKYDIIFTNPPYSLAQEFIEKSFDCLEDGGQVIMFLNISFITGEKRKNSLYANRMLKSMYVFGKRQGVWRNGEEFDENGKRWSGTMNFAWFIFEKNAPKPATIFWI